MKFLPSFTKLILLIGFTTLLIACGGGSEAVVSTNCREALVQNPGMPDGSTLIDPDGNGPNTAFTAYCDQTTDGGGWILTYKVRSNIDVGDNPWWDQVMPGSGATFPTNVSEPVGSTEGPTMIARATLTANIGATEWRATTVQSGIVTFDVTSSYAGIDGQGLHCFASGICGEGRAGVPAPSVDQACSSADIDGQVLTNTLGGPITAGGTGFVCDVGWTTCAGCADWSSIRTDNNAGGISTNAVKYVGDSFIALTDATTFYWIR